MRHDMGAGPLLLGELGTDGTVKSGMDRATNRSPAASARRGLVGEPE
ncbi:hypothetical protein ACPXCE_28460 [Streptomyces sp. DT24]